LYKLENLIPTPLATMQQAYEMAKKNGLKYVYIGNIESDRGNNTFCSDGQLAIKRVGYFVMENNLVNGKCANGEAVAGVWQ
jgi:pyruvate formate lyase activating enzyme